MMVKNMLSEFIRRKNKTARYIDGQVFYHDSNTSASNFKIEWKDYVSFWEKYCETLEKEPESINKTTLYEYNNDHSTTLRITFGFTFNSDSTLEDDHIREIFICCLETIFDLFDTKKTKNVSACVCEGKNSKRYLLDFSFQHLKINKEYFNDNMIKALCENLRAKNIRKMIPDFMGDWESVIYNLTDFSSIYGSKFSKNDPFLTFKYTIFSDEDEPADDINESLSSINHHLIITKCKSDIERIKKNEDEEGTDYTPLLLSCKYSDETLNPKAEENGTSRMSYHTDISSSSEIDMVYHLLPLLSKERFDNSMYRKQIGRIIYNIFNKDISGLELLNTYSKYNKDENLNFWEEYSIDTGINDYLSIRTIGYFARIDNPDEYESWHNAWMEESVIQSFDKIELNVAEVMYRLLWLEFLTVGKNEWYRFSSNGNKLIKSISNVDFYRRFDDLISFYNRCQKENCDRLETAIYEKDPSKRLNAAERSKVICEITKKLGTRAYQRAIEAHCFTKFYRERIDEYFDSNPNLMAWGNCVTEVYEDEMYTRPGKMEDFITMNSDIDYNKDEYSEDHPKIKELLYWFQTMLVDEDLIQCFLNICSSFLFGRNVEKVVYAFCGPSGNNSKTMVQKLLQKILSVYNVDFPVSILTDTKQSSSGPCPEIAQARGARKADIAEPDGNISFMGSLIKRYSGGDRIFARKLHENGSSFEPMFKMVLYCNAVPPIEEADNAVENRIVIIPFLSRYCSDASRRRRGTIQTKEIPNGSSF